MSTLFLIVSVKKLMAVRLRRLERRIFRYFPSLLNYGNMLTNENDERIYKNDTKLFSFLHLYVKVKLRIFLFA